MENITQILFSLLIIFASAKLLGEIFERFKQSAVVGEILAGVILWPQVLNLIEHSEMVTLIGGSIGIEALVRKKPVLVLSPCTTYNVLNESKMLKHVVDLNRISSEIMELLDSYEYDDGSFRRFQTRNTRRLFQKTCLFAL